EGHFFIRMRGPQRGHNRRQPVILTYEFHTVLAHLFDLADLADEGIAALQCAELPFPERLPAARIVIAEPAGAGFEQCRLHLLDMAWRHEESQFVHSTLSC